MKDKSNSPNLPKVGQKIYVNSHFYISEGSRDVIGGLATISRIERRKWGKKFLIFVEVKEHPGHSYNWTQILIKEQSVLKKEFGNEVARIDPDHNMPWIESSDIVNGKKYTGSPIM